MKHTLLCLLSAIMLTFVAAPAHAGFVAKKHAVTNSVSASGITAASSHGQAAASMQQFANTLAAKANSPSGLFVRWMQNGTIGLFAFLFGILGFFLPVVSIAAVIFGFLGMKRFCSGRMMAVLGFTMGVVAIALVVFGAYAPFF